MSDGPTRYAPDLITHYLLIGFAGPLLVSTVGFILYGASCYQFFSYVQGLAKKDPALTKLWVWTVMLFNSATTLYQVYFNWIQGIEQFSYDGISKAGTVSGNTVILYSVVVMLTQMFWIICVDAMRNPKPNPWIITPVAFASFCSFSVAIAVGVLSTAFPQPNGAWPSPTVSILLRCVLGLDLGIDLSILMLMLTQLRGMREELGQLRKTYSRLTYTFASMTTLSTCVIIVELILNVPQSGTYTSFLKIALTFAPVIAPLYTLSMLSVLNSRGGFWAEEEAFTSEGQEQDSGENVEDRRPQMKFTNEACSRSLPLRNHAATEPVIDIEREAGSRRSSLEECDDHRRHGNDGSADQIQSTQFGIQTI